VPSSGILIRILPLTSSAEFVSEFHAVVIAVWSEFEGKLVKVVYVLLTGSIELKNVQPVVLYVHIYLKLFDGILTSVSPSVAVWLSDTVFHSALTASEVVPLGRLVSVVNIFV
jgi:hypothetical protein